MRAMNEDNNGEMPICPWCDSREYVEEIPYKPWMKNTRYFQCEHGGDTFIGNQKYFKEISKRPVAKKVLTI